MAEEPSQVEPGIHPKLTNPLSDETRKERVYLLGMSAIGTTIVFTGLIPTEISTLGIKFGDADQNSLLLIFALVVSYYLAAFVSYALSDYVEWLTARRDLSIGRMRRDVQEERARIQEEMRANRAEIQEILRAREERAREERARIQEEQDVNQTLERTADEMDALDIATKEVLKQFLDEIDERETGELAGLAEYEREIAEASGVPFGFAGPIITLRFYFEFILPPIVGAFAVVALLVRAL